MYVGGAQINHNSLDFLVEMLDKDGRYLLSDKYLLLGISAYQEHGTYATVNMVFMSFYSIKNGKNYLNLLFLTLNYLPIYSINNCFKYYTCKQFGVI